jgi:dihydrofolate reductase
MRNLVWLMHTSLDGFVAGPKGEMDWIVISDALFDYAKRLTDAADTALYGRLTWQMMEAYWPAAADKPNASRHDIDHSRWYNNVAKRVVSRTIKGATPANTAVIDGNVSAEIVRLKQQAGRDILMIGSPSVAHALMAENLIDDYWLFVNPILLGQGKPLFKNIKERAALNLAATDVLPSGVVCLHYEYRPHE